MPRIRIPSALRGLTAGHDRIATTGTTVRAALADLERQHPGVAARILDGAGAIRPFMRVFVGDVDLESLGGLDAMIDERADVELVAALAGGALRDDQVRRYARHILLPDVGGIGQTALLAACARVDLPGVDDPMLAESIAIGFVAAGGAGAIVVGHGAASAVRAADLAGPTLTGAQLDQPRVDALRARLAVLAPDCSVTADDDSSPIARPLVVDAAPAWFPASADDAVARALWRGGHAAARWMADVACRPAALPADAPPAIAIPPAALAAIYAHARAAFPAECCGYLVGARTADAIDGVIACRNAQADGAIAGELAPDRGPDTAFAIAGAELFAFARSLDGPRPARIVYHSHTNGRAYFSALDRAAAHPPGGPPAYPVQHLVVGVLATGVVECAQLAWSESARALVEVARWTAR